MTNAEIVAKLKAENRPSFAELLTINPNKLPLKVENDSTRQDNAACMAWELFRDKVLTSFQANEILLAMGCTTVRDTNGVLLSYR